MNVLAIGARGGTPDEMIAAAHSYWNEGHAGGHIRHVAQGRQEAQRIESAFRERCSLWAFSPHAGPMSRA